MATQRTQKASRIRPGLRWRLRRSSSSAPLAQPMLAAMSPWLQRQVQLGPIAPHLRSLLEPERCAKGRILCTVHRAPASGSRAHKGRRVAQSIHLLVLYGRPSPSGGNRTTPSASVHGVLLVDAGHQQGESVSLFCDQQNSGRRKHVGWKRKRLRMYGCLLKKVA